MAYCNLCGYESAGEQRHYDSCPRVQEKTNSFAAGRAKGYREGQEAMRERAAQAAHASALVGKVRKPSEKNQARAYFAESAIRALPIEELPK